jgi:hypothetical protein
VGQPDQQQQEEGNRGKQCVESQRAGKERDIVAVGLVQGAAGEGQPAAQPGAQR